MSNEYVSPRRSYLIRMIAEADAEIMARQPEPEPHHLRPVQASLLDERSCTCHPDDNPPKPCPRKFALSECEAAAGVPWTSEPKPFAHCDCPDCDAAGTSGVGEVQPQQDAMRSGFMFGWKAAAVWAHREDLIADIGSPAYEKDRDAACGVMVGEHEPWVPYLSDRADGVRGHYAICRWNPRGYREAWNLRSHSWASCSDEVLTLEQAQKLLAGLTLPSGVSACGSHQCIAGQRDGVLCADGECDRANGVRPDGVTEAQAPRWCDYVAEERAKVLASGVTVQCRECAIQPCDTCPDGVGGTLPPSTKGGA